ncbi:MAG: ATP-dependent sacrificial sulfur transferase LarE [Propionibacteriaceae bacterium]|jgi:uncharacterized protein|nr:ATP-dependent sacrificial sulfur transferase LarE [Propionibacteriaceae bacterium]
MSVLDAQVSEQAMAWEAHVAQAMATPGRLAVAFSGGVDSAVLLAVAARQRGVEQVVAILAVSASLAAHERIGAHRTAAQIGVPVVEVATTELDDPNYRANGPDRCFHCKNTLFTQITDEIVEAYGIDAVAYGENADDASRPDRPGAQAATDHHVLRPLAQAGLTKAMVRSLARELGLDVADKPAAPCLASRIPHFEDVTADKLRQIDRAEQVTRDLGFTDARVRHHGDIARVELPLEELPRAFEPETRRRLVSALRHIGFGYVTLDLAGIQSGAFTLSVVNHE